MEVVLVVVLGGYGDGDEVGFVEDVVVLVVGWLLLVLG